MLVNADFKALEWLVAVWMSKDQRGYTEIRAGIDQHEENKLRFNLPSRLIAKTFVFRLIYGGGAWSYAHDPDFMDVSKKEAFWQDVIDKFYLKYHGIKEWHDWLVQEAMSSGRISLPTGRFFIFAPKYEGGEWPRTTILNYPVQGLSADLMVLVRCLLWKKLKAQDLKQSKLICTVHDSVVFDSPKEEVPLVTELLFETWEELPKAFEQYFGLEFDLPCKVEVSVGQNWKDQTEIKRGYKNG